MTTLDSETQVLDIVDRFFTAMAAGDIATASALFTDDAVVWHNYDQVEHPKDESLAVLKFFPTVQARFDSIRRYVVPDGCIQQHVVRRPSANGTEVELPAIQHIYITDGRITRIEEYFDTAQAATFTAI